MSQTLQCDACQKRVRLPENAVPGKRYRCPGCGAAMSVPDAGAEEQRPLLDEADVPNPYIAPEPTPEPQRLLAPAGDADLWQNVRLGVWAQMAAHLMYLIGLFMALLFFGYTLMAEPSYSSSSTRETILLFVMVVMSIIIIGNWVVAVVAQGLWMAAPWQFGARGLAIALLVLDALILMRFSSLFGAFSEGPFGRNRELEIVFMFSFLLIEGARLMVLGAFLYALGRNLGHTMLSKSAAIQALATPFVLGGLLLLSFLIFKIKDPSKTVGAAVIGLNLFAQAGLVGWGLVNLLFAQGACGSRANPRY